MAWPYLQACMYYVSIHLGIQLIAQLPAVGVIIVPDIIIQFSIYYIEA